MNNATHRRIPVTQFRYQLFRTLILWVLLSLAHQTTWAAITPEKIAKQTWHRVSTPNFELITDISKSNAVELAERVEKFRQFVGIISSMDPEIKFRPVTIFATKRKKNYELFTNQSDWLKKTTGFFSDTLPATYAVINLKGQHLARHNLHTYYHEYVHYLAATSISYDLPFWFSEGYADYLASIEFVGKKKINYAKPLIHHLEYINNSRWIPISEILAERRGQHGNINRIRKTYAQGYYLTHYFYADNQRRKNLFKFLNLRNAGTELELAAQQAFGMTLDELNTAVKSYVDSPREMRYLSIELKQPLELKDFTVHKLSPEELLTEFALFTLRSELGSDKANDWLQHALKINPQHAPALAGLAQTHLDQDLEKAQTYFEQANQLAPNDPYVATVKGHLYRQLLALKAEQTGDAEAKSDYWTQAVHGYNTAINSGILNVEALVGAAYLYTGRESDAKVVELLSFAYQYAPNNSAVQYSLIRALLRNQNAIEADQIATIIRNNPHSTRHQLENFEAWYQELRTAYLTEENLVPTTPSVEQNSLE